MDIAIRVFGSIEVIGANGRLGVSDFSSRKAKQVCQVLALAGGRPVSKDQLLDALWTDRLPRDPGATVEQAISMLRSSLAAVSSGPVVITERGRYRLDPGRVVIDLVRFNGYVEAASRAEGRERIDALWQALSIATGEVLEDEPAASWAETERERYRRRVERVALDLARLALAHDEAMIAHEAAERAHQASTVVLEEAYAADISALVRLDRRHEARALMRELERRLADEESSEPSAETAALRPLLRSIPRREATGSQRPVTTTLARPKGRRLRELPLLGRADALATITSAIDLALRGTSGLVLIEGVSGSGKSRLLDAVADGAASHADTQIVSFACASSDLGHPMLAAGRLLRVLARRARARTMPQIDEAVAPMFGRLADALDRLGPTIVLVDDLHLADAASVAVLASLVAPAAVQSLCVVAARRPTDPGGDPLPRGAVRHAIRLTPLSAADVDQLGVEGAWSETGGHPGSLAMCIEAARNGGVLSANAVASTLARVDEAGELSRTVLELAAALPQPFDSTEVAFQARLARETVVDLLRRAVDRGLLREVGSGRLTFAGDLTRRVLESAAVRTHTAD